jgi:hypothetical protein
MSWRDTYRDQTSIKCPNFWQSVLRFGVPFIILYQGLDYVIFRIAAANVGMRYPWRIEVVTDIPCMFLVSTLWWARLRRTATRKHQIQEKQG